MHSQTLSSLKTTTTTTTTTRKIESLLGRQKRGRLMMKLAWGTFALSSRHYHANTCCLVHGLSLRMGKSSFVRKQYRNRDNPSLSITHSGPTSEEILLLARQNHKQTHGSKTFIASWRHWVEKTTTAIRHDVSMNLPHPVHVEELAKLSFNLGVAADKGEMPSFSNPGARSGYALDYFCRARLLAGLLLESTLREDFSAYWKSSKNFVDKTVHMTSLGGGPGFDFVAAAMAVTFLASGDTQHRPSLQTTILDYEVGWEDLVVEMNASTKKILQQPDWNCQWGGMCDITKPLSHPSNQACLAMIPTTNIWTCQYCVAENAQNLRASNYIFFRDLWNVIPDDTVIILTETTPRLWPEFYRILEDYCPFFHVSFPNHKGPQMVLRKCQAVQTTGIQLCPRDAEVLQGFQEIAEKHDLRQRSGWERQGKKRTTAAWSSNQ